MIDKQRVKSLIEFALNEDFAAEDITTIATFGTSGPDVTAKLLAKQDMVLSALDVANLVFKTVSPEIKLIANKKDGNFVRKGEEIAKVKGNVADILRAERVALNFLQQLSGVATLTRIYVDLVKGYDVQILDTRKTIPGYRCLQKQAVLDGGGVNHRTHLRDQFLLKDNHIDACGSVTKAIERMQGFRQTLPEKEAIRIEVETRNMDEVKEAIEAGAEIVLLDNMDYSMVKEAVDYNQKRALLEVSGGINLETVVEYAKCGIDRISIGALTHSAGAADISLLIDL